MKIVYITWGEPPQNTGIYASQVIRQLQGIKEQEVRAEVVLVSGIPIILGEFARKKFEYINELQKIRQDLIDIDIDHKIIPIWAASNWFYSRKGEFNFFYFISSYYLSTFINNFRPDIVHCRSYHAAYAAILARKASSLSYKIVFDARGLWPEEGVLLGRKSNDDYIHSKKIEKYLLSQSDVTIAVSDTMQTHYEKIGVKNCKTVYLSAPVKVLKPSRANRGHHINTTLCYVGVLADNQWHKPYMLFEFYKKYRQCVNNPQLLIVTKSNPQKIIEQRGDIPLTEIKITSTSTPEELSTCLQSSSFGVLPYFIPSTHYEHLVAKTVIASKTAEYLSAGLPVLVNKYCGGASEIIDKYGLGLSYDPAIMTEITKHNLDKLLNYEIAKQAIQFAEENFDYKQNAKKYHDIYLGLFSQ